MMLLHNAKAGEARRASLSSARAYPLLAFSLASGLPRGELRWRELIPRLAGLKLRAPLVPEEGEDTPGKQSILFGKGGDIFPQLLSRQPAPAARR